jgi:hypothetical protein
MGPDPHRVATRLGLDEATIARLETRGHLTRLEVTEREIRERLFRAHLAHLLRRVGGGQGVRGRTTLCVLVAVLAIVAPHSAGAVTTGQKSVLVVLATPSTQPYAVAEVERTMREAGEFLRTASLGHLELHTDVTPWLTALTSDPGCGGATNRGLEAIVTPVRLAAERVGYDASGYDDLIYVIGGSNCGFQGSRPGAMK